MLFGFEILEKMPGMNEGSLVGYVYTMSAVYAWFQLLEAVLIARDMASVEHFLSIKKTR